jgi:hypothetical protein
MTRIRLLPLLAAILFVLAGTSAAHAGQYTLSYDFAGDLSGWGGYVEPGYTLCGRSSPAGCPDISTNRILARAGGSQAIWSQGRWEWTAPPGTTIAAGALTYRTRMLHSQFFARVKVRATGDWDAAPAIVAEQQTTALTEHVVALPGGYRQVGVSLYAHPAVAGLVTGAWDDYVTLVRLDVTVQDFAPPTLSWVDGGGLLDGAWHANDVCGTVAIADGESGVGAVWIASDAATSRWDAAPTGSQYQPGRPSAQPLMCLSATALGDGAHAGLLGGMDASGGQAALLSFVAHIDRTPPVASLAAPGAVADGARPPIALDVGDATSGVASVEIQLDGVPLTVGLAAGRASARPDAPLAYGAHALTWSLADAAGNRSDGAAHFSVPDDTPPSIVSPEPQAGAAVSESETLGVNAGVTDDGSGVDPDSLDLRLDGTPVEGVWRAGNVVHGVVARRLVAGLHHLLLEVADRAGNRARLAWDFSVVASASAGAGSGPVAGGTVTAAAGSPGAAPLSPAAAARRRDAAGVHAFHPRLGSTRPRIVIVRLHARARLRIAVGVRCGRARRTLHVRASAVGVATLRVVCAGAASVRLNVAPGRVLVRLAARRLPLRLHVLPQSRSAPTVARVSGRLAELRGRVLVLEALSATGWHAVGRVRADAAGAFATSFAILHAGQFALRARVPALAGAASTPYVLTMR